MIAETITSTPMFFQIVFICIVLWGVILYGRKHQRLLLGIVERQAQKRGGRVEKKRSFIYPDLILTQEGKVVRVSMQAGSKHQPAYTRLESSLVMDEILDVRVFRENFFTKIGDKLGWKDFQTNDPEFDEVFSIHGK